MRRYHFCLLLSIALACMVVLPAIGQEESPKGENSQAKAAEKANDEKPAPVKSEQVKSEQVESKQVKSEEVKPQQGKQQVKPGKEKAASKKSNVIESSERKLLPNVGSLKHPFIPGQPWRIHDLKRPRPKSVTPGVIDTMPPSDALILFDGDNLDEWYQLGSEDEAYEAQWKVRDGYFEIEPRTGSILTLESFGSCQLHVEWYIPEGTTGTSQQRGNSGIKLMERYEVQVLDSYKSKTYADGQAASIYGQYPPLVNAVRPQGEWQTYDIIFEAPVFDDGKLKQPPVITVLHNGVLVQHRRELIGPTGLRGSGQDMVPPAAPLMLQDHGNRIRFRNIWIRDL